MDQTKEIKLIQFIFNLFQIRTWQVTKSENKIFLKQYPIKATLGQAYDEEWTRPSGKDVVCVYLRFKRECRIHMKYID
jgi:hypothetical protein